MVKNVYVQENGVFCPACGNKIEDSDNEKVFGLICSSRSKGIRWTCNVCKAKFGIFMNTEYNEFRKLVNVPFYKGEFFPKNAKYVDYSLVLGDKVVERIHGWQYRRSWVQIG